MVSLEALPLPLARWLFSFQWLLLLSVHLTAARAANWSIRSGGRGTWRRPNL